MSVKFSQLFLNDNRGLDVFMDKHGIFRNFLSK